MDQCSLYLLKGCRMQRLHGLNPVGFVLEQSSHIQNKDEPRLERCCFFMAPMVLTKYPLPDTYEIEPWVRGISGFAPVVQNRCPTSRRHSHMHCLTQRRPCLTQRKMVIPKDITSYVVLSGNSQWISSCRSAQYRHAHLVLHQSGRGCPLDANSQEESALINVSYIPLF